jgi:hypothetical protein
MPLSVPSHAGLYQYFLKVVPTTYVDLRNRTIHTNQFSVTEHFRETASPAMGGGQLPGVFLFYDLSPIKVRGPGARAGMKEGWVGQAEHCRTSVSFYLEWYKCIFVL